MRLAGKHVRDVFVFSYTLTRIIVEVAVIDDKARFDFVCEVRCHYPYSIPQDHKGGSPFNCGPGHTTGWNFPDGVMSRRRPVLQQHPLPDAEIDDVRWDQTTYVRFQALRGGDML